MAAFYDARGNIYGVVTPARLRSLGVALPGSAAQAARDRRLWSEQAIAALCDWAPGTRPPGPRPTVATVCWWGRSRTWRPSIC
ncbi:hypothetical protein PBOI14_52310 [Pseudomonas sp. Boi14]|nr:hypothetical protein PBOI14_52310 [Pseudomonas sp. Boi14]